MTTSTTTRAAVLSAVGKPLEIVELEVQAPRSGEVLVRLAASGVCHTDKAIADGDFPFDLPLVLGHEGAGVIEAVGEGVTRVHPGDHVVLSFMPQCGQCLWCRKGQPQLCGPGRQAVMSGGLADRTPRFRRDGAPIKQLGGLGTFSEHLVAQEIAAIPIDPAMPLAAAALIGCGVMTGIGAARKTATIHDGDSVVVVGCGGVGLNVIQGARLAGAAKVIAVDRLDSKLELAKRFGATDVVAASGDSTVADVLALTDGIGADVAFEVVGRVDTAQLALDVTRAGGQMCMVGMAAADAVLPLPLALEMTFNAKQILGCTYGSSDMRNDVPEVVRWWSGGQLQINELVSQEVTLDQINSVLDHFEASEHARTIISFEHS